MSDSVERFEKKMAAFLEGKDKPRRKAANGRTMQMLEEILKGPLPGKGVAVPAKP
jgi:hypothetical protein